ncbi:MAG TPA: proton-conducting transporter membrane subunit [Bacteroidia bacterium]|nr:proton-conducting transporter membrane subunit [Bacteroidia bacterium]
MSMDIFQLLFFSIIICGAGIVLIPFLSPSYKSAAGFALVLLNALATSVPAINSLAGDPVEIHLKGTSFFNDVPLRIDALSAWFMLIINLTCLNGALYGIGYMKTYKNQKGNFSLHWILFVLFQTSMLWVCMLQHGLAFLIAWEIMSVTSLLLIIFEHQRHDTLKAGVNYLVQMHIAVVFLSVAFIWVYISEGSFDFNSIALFFEHHKAGWLFLFFFIGFGIKAGFIPLHTWLPHAHPAAPSHISGVMSGVIVKMGIYGVFRIVMYLSTDLLKIGEVILILSVLTAFYGILNAAVHRDFKRMLAFCTIENIGIIGMGIGLGMIGKGIGNNFIMFLGFAGAVLHTLNHSLYKSLLFFSAGNVLQQTQTRDMEQLGGLIKKMPSTAFLFLAGALAICGLPPLNGFVSEFLIYAGLIEGIKTNNVQFSSMMILCMSGLAIVGSISLLTFTKAFGTIFLGSPRTGLQHHPKEVSVIMRLPLYIILTIMLLIGIFPSIILIPVTSVATIFNPSASYGDLISGPLQTLTIIGRVSLLMSGLAFLIFYIRRNIAAQKPSAVSPTWGCGYAAPTVKMQYTGKSFSKSLAKLFSFITTEKKKYHEIESLSVFPETRKYSSHYAEFFETHIIDKANNRIIAFFNYFTFIHKGKIQMYVLYGFFFIVAILAATFFNWI